MPRQAEEARNKRRVGLGFTGLGDALVMLNLRYDTEPAFLWRGGERLVFLKTAPENAKVRTRWQTITITGSVDPHSVPGAKDGTATVTSNGEATRLDYRTWVLP